MKQVNQVHRRRGLHRFQRKESEDNDDLINVLVLPGIQKIIPDTIDENFLGDNSVNNKIRNTTLYISRETPQLTRAPSELKNGVIKEIKEEINRISRDSSKLLE